MTEIRQKPDFTVFPAIDVRGGKCVRLIQGNYDKQITYSDSPASQAALWEKQGAHFLHIVDLDGAKEGRPVNLKTIEAITKAVKIPCQLGGGIRSIDDAHLAFNAGVERIIVGTAACENPEFVEELVQKFSHEKVVIGIDAKNGKASVRGWLKDTNLKATDLAEEFARKGINRFIYTDIHTDGMLSGPNFSAISEFCDAVSGAKVIASGGVASTDDVIKLMNLAKKNIEGVIIGKALYDGKIVLSDLVKLFS
ncbi:MAG TPA: 1-(5-phosphoribosyl)-5-((5-phosphoribosylamino)methylideneamino)imidazole-4-carboxamide isomerase [Lentisphaeria bacterium]|nr:MAG: 1-(5-phosphoribosyl)-5-[(5-phosphoribosylamino)methylideneamino]imidazole-4-carboxamide isomerase [Lentisphaerae bacterium GWF2_50_93]HCE43107.1 1-(5-phosphoribosyl)-5-((5-phosphoribosylamino)methylideneamino)imidazole-4-carboxamide isomerase [Lentisphaeria bacterium]